MNREREGGTERKREKDDKKKKKSRERDRGSWARDLPLTPPASRPGSSMAPVGRGYCNVNRL
jgi:hypothetical protein